LIKPRLTLGVWAVIAGFGVLVGVIWFEIMVWRQCLSDEPWWYCLRILG